MPKIWVGRTTLNGEKKGMAQRKTKFRLKVAFYILGMSYTLVLPETQVISYLHIVLKHMCGLAGIIEFLLPRTF